MSSWFTFLLLLICYHGFAQYRVHYKNAVYPEVGGNAVYYSLNYERLVSKRFPVRIGIGSAQKITACPALLGVLVGNSAHHLQLMGGVTYVHSKKTIDTFGQAIPENEFPLTASIGYRYQQRGDRLLFYIAYTPLFGKAFTPSAGIACGYRFN